MSLEVVMCDFRKAINVNTKDSWILFYKALCTLYALSHDVTILDVISWTQKKIILFDNQNFDAP